MQSLLDFSAKALELDNENNGLRQENIRLKEALEFQEELTYVKEKNSYWTKETNDGPFCSGCWDDRKKAIRLTEYAKHVGRYRCPVCNHIYKVEKDTTEEIISSCYF
jgi:hypothetical protein